jgi:hypothetical protein
MLTVLLGLVLAPFLYAAANILLAFMVLSWRWVNAPPRRR